jgi:hypothetical protein
MLANRNRRQAAEDRLSWHDVDGRLKACVVHLFRARDSAAKATRRHQGGTLRPIMNHVKRVGGVQCGGGMHVMHP